MLKQINIIYIAGYGRSGSTLLEKLLHCQPSLNASGELANFFKLYGSSSAVCSCGHVLDKCNFWSNVANELVMNDFSVKGFSNFAKIQQKRESLISHGGSFFSNKYHKVYSNLMASLFEAVSHQFNSEEKILIDSSKTAYSTSYRPIAISQMGKYRIRVIHLVRDCRGVAWSVKKGLNRKIEKGEKGRVFLPVLRAIVGWVYSNKAASRLKGYLGENSYCLVRYEDLVEDPVEVLKNLESFLKLDLKESRYIAQKAREGHEVQLPEIHQLAGNRMRFSYSLSISPDYAWKEKLNTQTKAFIKIITMPLMRKYGYL